MDNQKDNSELFEIFQNKLDLEEEQKKSGESDEDDQEQEKDQQPPANEDTTSRPDETSQKSESSTSTETRDTDTRTREPETTETSSDPSTETGTYIKKLEQEKALEGKVVLSRGASVFLLLIVAATVIGAYFIGFQTGNDESSLQAKTGKNVEGQTSSGDQNASGDSSRIPRTNRSNIRRNSSSNNSSSSGGGSTNSSAAARDTFYTIGVIGFDASAKQLADKHVENIREEGINWVNRLSNPKGRNQHWVVIGRFYTAQKAKQFAENLKDKLKNVENSRNYRTDVMEINRQQAKQIQR